MPLTTGAEACTTYDGFFLDEYHVDSHEVRAATALCSRCPLVRACLIWALDNPTLTYDGIWGATTPAQRKKLRQGLIERLGPEGMSRTLRTEYDKTMAALSSRCVRV
ncbi:WhiB family transcriptional regulator [Streptomyces sp. NPDC006654]|uniref:WhiB family transcriptional regulator n=1 Tax=Streptomyces sp. NPDC006654 TaxID=3156897 RepID=UPI0033E36630